MYISLILAILSLPRMDVEVGNKDCQIKTIIYTDQHSYIHAIGNCDMIYDKCIEDNCDVQHKDYPDLNFGKKTVG